MPDPAAGRELRDGGGRRRDCSFAFVFFARAEGVGPDGAIYGQDAVQVVEFVLQKFGERAGGFEALDGAFLVFVADADYGGTFHVDQEIGEREAIVPNAELVFALEFDGGIAQAPGAAIQFDIY